MNGFRPREGCGLLRKPKNLPKGEVICFRPREGCGLLQEDKKMQTKIEVVSVPVRGVGCFWQCTRTMAQSLSFRPREGCGLLPEYDTPEELQKTFPSP